MDGIFHCKRFEPRMVLVIDTRELPERITMKYFTTLVAALFSTIVLAQPAAAENSAISVMQEYMEFSPYEAGIILPPQLTKDVFGSIVCIDTRSADQFAKGTIPGSKQYRMARSSRAH